MPPALDEILRQHRKSIKRPNSDDARAIAKADRLGFSNGVVQHGVGRRLHATDFPLRKIKYLTIGANHQHADLR